jgi:hypothetical protein
VLKTIQMSDVPPVSPPNGDTSLTHVMRLGAHSTTPPTPTAMGQSIYSMSQLWGISEIFLEATKNTTYRLILCLI